MDRENVTLAALAAAGENASFTPVQVQKLFFLIDKQAANLIGGPYFHFVPYDYGPFDRSVYDQLDILSDKKALSIASGGRYRRYILTGEGFQLGEQALSELPKTAQTYFREVANWVRKLSFEQLVSSIYKAYPEMKANSIFRE